MENKTKPKQNGKMYNLLKNNFFLILLQALHIMQQPHSGQSHFSKRHFILSLLPDISVDKVIF